MAMEMNGPGAALFFILLADLLTSLKRKRPLLVARVFSLPIFCYSVRYGVFFGSLLIGTHLSTIMLSSSPENNCFSSSTAT